MRTAYPLRLVFCALTLFWPTAWAEHTEPNAPLDPACLRPQSADGDKSRPLPGCGVIDDRLSALLEYRRGVDLMKDAFSNLGKPFVYSAFTGPLKMLEGEKERVVLSLPRGLEKAAKEKDETDTSAMMAIFFGTVTAAQRDAVVKTVETERESELKKTKEDRRDEKHLALLNRLFWAGKALQGILVKDPEAQAFLKKFVGEKLDFKSGDFKMIQEQNALVATKIKEANDGSKDAQKYLRETLNRSALLSYVDHQMKDGDKKAASKLVDAVSWKQNDAGPKFLDMVGPGGEPQRLYIGKTPEDFQNAIKAFSTEKGGFFGNALANESFATVAKEWYADASGNLVKGVPAGATPGIGTPTPKETPKPTDEPPKVAVSAEQARALVTSACTSCHAASPSGDSAANFMIKKGDKAYSLREALAAVDADPTNMKNSPKMNQTALAQLRQFALSR